MRVLLTTPYDLAVPGGVNRHALDLLHELSRRGHDVQLLGPSSRVVYADDPRIIRVGRIWHGSLNGAVSRITLDVDIAPTVRRLVRSFRPDVVHVQEPFAPTLNTLALLFAGGARRVGTFHTYSEHSLGYLWSWPWCNWVNAQLDAHIAVSEAARDFVGRFHAASYRVIPNGVQLPPATQRRPLRPPHRPMRVLFVGRAGERRKGFAVLRAALKRLEQQAPGAFALSVVGPDEPPRDDLPITWHGHATDAELSAQYAAADVVVVPSLGGESFGLVALEALAHGVPVVASQIRGYSEWLAARDGSTLVAPSDVDALASALDELRRDESRYLECARCAPELAAKYDVRTTCDRLLAVYRSA